MHQITEGRGKLLALSPHTDDVELGAGGSIARWIEEGVEIFVAVFSGCVESLPKGAPKDLLIQEFHRSMEALGVPPANRKLYDFPVRRFSEHRQDILEELVALQKELNPARVLIPASVDRHQDHEIIHSEGVRAFWKTSTILGYELPWNSSNFPAQHYVTLEPRHLEAKMKAMECYRSKLELGRRYFEPSVLDGIIRVRGVQVTCQLAKAFEIIRSCE